MNQKSKLFSKLCLLAGIVVLSSCQEEDVPLAEAQPQNLDAKMVELITKDGYETKDIYVKDGFYRVKGVDIVYDKDMAKNISEAESIEEQRWHGVQTYYSYTRDVRIYKDPSFPDYLYGGPLYYAARHWSNISPNINITITSSRSNADIVVSGYYDSGEYGWAVASLPTGNGNVGPWMWINTYQPHNQSYGDKVALMVHELGHTLGYRHTDQGGGYHIPGTPSSDRYSVMNSGVPNGLWQYNSAGWSYGDRAAINWAYGLY
ncbi:hypothetical protein C900_00186 [Fulvivirga imtechensis AK7]|uniref:Dual-action HEIGH metallo-peptidase n=1 Tax=Fulvivirga imtechensis AK7 TaxID=1237149 RepID=L8JML7_9BACT|nr:hypothetical protein [Fulvivirga imtechensis]ELR68642.1 hypothetical protein C900_00186 [Fulvivirga imtechensis AK7]